MLAYLPKTPDAIGQVKVLDGDSLEIGEQRIRLYGIDAPELYQKCKTKNNQDWNCGRESKAFLKEFIGTDSIECHEIEQDKYKRMVSICYKDDENINEAMISSGMAIVYKKYSNDFIKAETKAKALRIGLWQGKFMKPWNWRKNKNRKNL